MIEVSTVSDYFNFNAISASLVGCVTFPTCLGLIQKYICAPLRVTSSMKLFAPVVGSAAVFVSASTASLATAASYAYLNGSEMTFSKEELCVSGVLGMAVFKMLGGRFNVVLPSNLYKPGAFAHQWIPARWEQYAAHYERHFMQQFGAKHGCHSCGTRQGRFIADHQPPIKLSGPGELLRFYPHCRKCASLQGSALSPLKHARVAVRTHAVTSLRLYHLFLPVPFLVEQFRRSYQPASNTVITDVQPEPAPTTTVIREVIKIEVPCKQPALGNYLATILQYFNELPILGQFHIFVYFCIAIAAISSI
ncbi:uncharacterized protein [Dysidea avara]|uniref:uncharacterized protein n=1 Tax=Dysidea avara TaxID=196820 RepID=UPI003318EFA0